MSDEALRALEKEMYDNAARFQREGTDVNVVRGALLCFADQLAAILSARQEVAPVADVIQWRFVHTRTGEPIGDWTECDDAFCSKRKNEPGYQFRELVISPAQTSEAREGDIERLCAQLADMEHGFRDMASKWSHDAAEMTHGIAATAVRSCVDEVFDFLGPDYDAAMRQEAE